MNPSHALYMNALALVMATTGVPIVYYGSEQGLTQDPDGSRGADNQKRQPLWRTGYSKSHPLFLFISRLARLRTQGLFDGTQRELWVLSNIYLFTRGERVLIVTSNLGDGQSLDITLPPSNVPDAFRRDGDITVCDLLLGDGQGRGEGDGCVRVSNVNRDGLNVHIDGGMPQVLMVVSSTRQARRMPVLAK
ncbi:unnamed protein product [Vitrella brassicaformis CCMP3155]|uniref:Glycosyl hydrolase family 13 catalytic domain-containing protein n=1 Tax=Vitrella brassicaformis (strain CCMP3155) TaxID=1169540 RepID=A0A0G4FXT2_VITBC|nr:unnamed protein product [Vitrella brassicaformis CCMP3155]|eukprot:CEM20232.1 unnamed protein product [Vitrella brassicaformis CCMP3155]